MCLVLLSLGAYLDFALEPLRLDHHVDRALDGALEAVGRLQHVPLHPVLPLHLHIVDGEPEGTLALHELYALHQLVLCAGVPLPQLLELRLQLGDCQIAGRTIRQSALHGHHRVVVLLHVVLVLLERECVLEAVLRGGADRRSAPMDERQRPMHELRARRRRRPWRVDQRL